MIAVFTACVHAAVINGVDFTTVYTGNVLPNNASPAWTPTLNGAAVATANSPAPDILTINTMASTGANLIYQINNTAVWNGSTSSTIEFSMKIDSILVNPTVLSAQQLYFSNGSRDFRFFFTPTSILVGNASGTQGSAVGSFATINLDTTVFNTYRLLLSGGSVSLYLNNSTTAAMTGYTGTQNVPSNTIYFGDGGGTIGGQAEWNYAAFTNAGAFPPVPEPSVVGLACAAVGLLFFVRNRRKMALS